MSTQTQSDPEAYMLGTMATLTQPTRDPFSL